MAKVRFENIEKAHLEIAYDNGGIHRERSEGAATAQLRSFLSRQPYDLDTLKAIDKWLGNLSEDDLLTICAGEITEQDVILAASPPFTQQLLTDIFEHVC